MNAETAVRPGDGAAHVLVVDDDRRLRLLLKGFLRREGHRVTAVESAARARQAIGSLRFDLIVLDVMMPGESGLDFARSRASAERTPILMLTARGEAEDRVKGLEAGVDDYLAKPFEPRELALRILSILRRTQTPVTTDRAVRFGDLTFDRDRLELRRGEEIVRLTDRERDILSALAGAEGRPVPRESLAASGEAGQDRSVDVLVNRLRRKIEDDPTNPRFLQTARGAGYRLALDG
jgi:two-component system, OmpR family, phosphate regulon response regulator OmpR